MSEVADKTIEIPDFIRSALIKNVNLTTALSFMAQKMEGSLNTLRRFEFAFHDEMSKLTNTTTALEVKPFEISSSGGFVLLPTEQATHEIKIDDQAFTVDSCILGIVSTIIACNRLHAVMSVAEEPVTYFSSYSKVIGMRLKSLSEYLLEFEAENISDEDKEQLDSVFEIIAAATNKQDFA